MGRSAARKAAVTRKRRTAAMKAATTRKRRAAQDSRRLSTPVCRPHDLLRGWDCGLGMAAQRVWISRDGASHDAGWKAVTRRDGSGERIDHACVADTGYRSPKRHREVCEQARKWSTVPWIIDGVLVYVSNLDRHFARAKTAGATILSVIEEGPPGRRYRAEISKAIAGFSLRPTTSA